MTNGTPNARRIKRALLTTEKGTVDRAIEIEDRVHFLEKQIAKSCELWEVATALGLSLGKIEQVIEEYESELEDLQKEYRG